MVETVSPEKLWEGFDVLIGGLGALSVRRMSPDESNVFNVFVSDSVNVLRKISPEIAEDFKAQGALFKAFGEAFMGKVDKAFGGILPSSGQVGVGLIIPQDIRYVATASAANPAYSGYDLNAWTISLTAGSAAYLLGTATEFFKPKPTVGARCAILLMKNGLIEVGTTPALNQVQVTTERISYPVSSIHPIVDQTIERGLTIYRYNLPFAIPMFYDFGVRLAVMPTVTKSSDLRMVGVIFYEYDHRKSLSYIT